MSTTIARQILAFGDPKLAAALEQSWGTLRPRRATRPPLIAKYKAILARDEPAGRRPRPRPRRCSAGCAASATSSSAREATSGPI